jgi:hypothetical protein
MPLLPAGRGRGIAVFPTRGGLYRHLAERDAEPEGKVVVELEGKLSEERDLDADAGALLVHPERIVEIRPLDAELLARLSFTGVAGPSEREESSPGTGARKAIAYRAAEEKGLG